MCSLCRKAGRASLEPLRLQPLVAHVACFCSVSHPDPALSLPQLSALCPTPLAHAMQDAWAPRSTPGYTPVLTMPWPSSRACLGRMAQRMREGQPPCPREWCSDDAQAMLPSARKSVWGWLLWLGLIVGLWLWLQSDASIDATDADVAVPKLQFDGATTAAAHSIPALAAVTPASPPLPGALVNAAESNGDTSSSAAAASITQHSSAAAAPAAAASSNILALKTHARSAIRTAAGVGPKSSPGIPAANPSPLSLKTKLKQRKRTQHGRRKQRSAH